MSFLDKECEGESIGDHVLIARERQDLTACIHTDSTAPRRSTPHHSPWPVIIILLFIKRSTKEKN